MHTQYTLLYMIITETMSKQYNKLVKTAKKSIKKREGQRKKSKNEYKMLQLYDIGLGAE